MWKNNWLKKENSAGTSAFNGKVEVYLEIKRKELTLVKDKLHMNLDFFCDNVISKSKYLVFC